jgi:Tol biopolymer transport system component/predicted Ser/Thr protein kinase
MSLAPGTRLGPYEILEPIGAGGMGEVYKARDPRLDRIVAIKVSTERFSERFEREARAVAALNHPGICTLHDVGPDYLVMEYIEGQRLKGPLPLEQALKYAAQICDALDAAHSKGVTHRDLKPANILVTKTGVKLLDFGLAKMAPVAADQGTMTMALTGKGQIVGTLYYMAPEQLQGGEADARSDIFSFGLVLYEMLTGRRGFDGSSAASVIAAILERPAPSVSEIAPDALDRVLKRCLEKDPELRWQSVRDLKAALELATAGTGAAAGSRRQPARPQIRLAWALAAVATVAALALGSILVFRKPAEPRVLRFTVPAPATIRSRILAFNSPEISPNGRSLAFIAAAGDRDQIWVRDLDSLSARPIAGTDGAASPFWSPDSRFIGFFAEGQVKKVEVSGGPVLTLCTGGPAPSGSWSSRDVIVFSSSLGSGLHSVAAAGGVPAPVTTAENRVTQSFPFFLPDGHHFLYTAVKSGNSTLYLADLDAGDNLKGRHEIQDFGDTTPGNASAVYAPPGYLLFMRGRTLIAEPFDADKGRITGDAVPVAEGLDRFSASQNGVLVYGTAGTAHGVELTWFNRAGKPVGTVGKPAAINWPALSPDEKRVAHDIADPASRSVDVWVDDLARGTASRMTFGAVVNDFPIWSPDGTRMAFRKYDQAKYTLCEKTADGSREQVLDDAPLNKRPDDWSRDGQYIIEEVTDPKTKLDIWVLPMANGNPGKPFPYLESPFNEAYAKLSPNGKWLAYTSDETNRNEVYVQEFAVSPTGRASGGGKWQISNNGGSRPVWSHLGKELYFISADSKLMAVEIKSNAGFEPGAPKPLFETRIGGSIDSWFDVSKDGRFLIPIRLEQAASEPMTVVVNWQAGLKK